MSEQSTKWYLIVVVVMLGVSIFAWNSKISADNKLAALEAKIKITEDIATIEKRLDAMKAREAEYLQINKKQAELNATLIALDKKRKELDKIKKEGIKKDVEKLNINQLNNEFGVLGITGVVTNGPTTK